MAVGLRIGIAGVWHETNTFAPGRTTLDERSVRATLGTVLKYREDAERVQTHGIGDLVRAAAARG